MATRPVQLPGQGCSGIRPGRSSGPVIDINGVVADSEQRQNLRRGMAGEWMSQAAPSRGTPGQVIIQVGAGIAGIHPRLVTSWLWNLGSR